MPWRTSPSASARPSMAPGQMPDRRAHQADDRRLPGDHAADLAGRRGHRAQERDLALALLDRQAHRAGHDEHRDEQRQPAERRGDGDQRGPRLLELGVLGLAARVAGEHRRAARCAARRRAASKPGPASTPIASTRPGWPARRAASASVRKIAVCCRTGWRGPGDADHGDGAGGFGGRQAQLRAERGAVAGDDLVGPGGRASGAQHVGRQRGAAPPVGDGGAAAEPGRRRHVGDRRADAGDGRQPGGERGAHAGALAERDVVVGADDLLPGHDRRGAGVALDGRMGAQRRLERHAAGHHERGRGDQRDQGAGEGAEAAAGAEEGETKHGSAPQVRELLGDLVGARAPRASRRSARRRAG